MTLQEYMANPQGDQPPPPPPPSGTLEQFMNDPNAQPSPPPQVTQPGPAKPPTLMDRVWGSLKDAADNVWNNPTWSTTPHMPGSSGPQPTFQEPIKDAPLMMGIKRGVQDVGDTAHRIWTDATGGDMDAVRLAQAQAEADFQKEYGDSWTASGGRMLGQTLATAPVLGLGGRAIGGGIEGLTALAPRVGGLLESVTGLSPAASKIGRGLQLGVQGAGAGAGVAGLTGGDIPSGAIGGALLTPALGAILPGGGVRPAEVTPKPQSGMLTPPQGSQIDPYTMRNLPPSGPSGPTSPTGIVPRPPTTFSEAVPLADALWRQNAANAGKQVDGSVTTALVNDLQNQMPKPGGLAETASPDNAITKLYNSAKNKAGQPTTLDDAQQYYSLLGDRIKDEYGSDGSLSSVGQQLQQVQRNFRESLAPRGDPTDPWNQALKGWQTAMQMRDLEALQTRAEGTANPVTSMQTQLGKMLRDPEQMRGWDPQTVADLQEIAKRNGSWSEIARAMTSRLPAAVAGGVATATGGLPVALGLGPLMSGATEAVAGRGREAYVSSQLARLAPVLERIGQQMPGTAPGATISRPMSPRLWPGLLGGAAAAGPVPGGQ